MPCSPLNLTSGQSHLVSACEVAIDVDKPKLQKLADVQTTFLRRLLSLNPRSMLVPLFTETGVRPLAYRRIVLALRYLLYLLRLPKHHYAHLALTEATNLATAGNPSWWNDLRRVLLLLPDNRRAHAIRSLLPTQSTTTETVLHLIGEVELACADYLQNIIHTSPKTKLLVGRLERDDKGRLITKTLMLRHYLHVLVPSHRISLTRILLSDHCLAEEQLRRETRYRPAYPPHLRLCRFGCPDMETPVHALLVCANNDELTRIRAHFFRDAVALCPALRGRSRTPEQMFALLYSHKKVVSVLARFAHHVLMVFAAVPLRVPQQLA